MVDVVVVVDGGGTQPNKWKWEKLPTHKSEWTQHYSGTINGITVEIDLYLYAYK